MDNDMEFKEIPREKKVRKKKHYMARFLIILCVIIALVAFLLSPVFNVKHISVTGNDYYTDQEVINMGNATKGGNIFIHSGISSIKSRLEGNPYFSSVKVSIGLPSTLKISVTERKQVAALIYGDQYIVIDVDGKVLRKTEIDPKITIIKGLTLSKIKVGEKVKAEEAQTLTRTLKMLSTMNKGDLYFKKIDVSGIFIKAYIYDTLIVKGIPAQMQKTIKSGDLQKVISKLFKSGYKRGTISLGDHNYMSFSPAC